MYLDISLFQPSCLRSCVNDWLPVRLSVSLIYQANHSVLFLNEFIIRPMEVI